ncbi:hypothetical protein LH464_19225 [Neorhizobium sp. T786]|uniref:hypothetical protein n=1 Tax=Pseudorhizobium xiangyangii TaxID=2883104 RepID=UPI001CFFFCA5|nr:hypothetical protein [Neorhizobium xiangyangii]MCB5204603.1 hypothetical protein [Neorhizobium xiangyangii]
MINRDERRAVLHGILLLRPVIGGFSAVAFLSGENFTIEQLAHRSDSTGAVNGAVIDYIEEDFHHRGWMLDPKTMVGRRHRLSAAVLPARSAAVATVTAASIPTPRRVRPELRRSRYPRHSERGRSGSGSAPCPPRRYSTVKPDFRLIATFATRPRSIDAGYDVAAGLRIAIDRLIDKHLPER